MCDDQKQDIPNKVNPYICNTLVMLNLSSDTTEDHIYDTFSQTQDNVRDIHICRDAVTGRSLRYAYIDFNSIQDASNTLLTKSLRFLSLRGKTTQLMYKVNKDILNNNTVKTQIHVKNLHESIDEQTLFDVFSVFGEILSVRMYKDRETQKSMGYGYVQYVHPEDAKKAIEGVNGMTISDRRVHCQYWKPPDIREKEERFSNINISNIPYGKTLWKERDFIALFRAFSNVDHSYSCMWKTMANFSMRTFESAKQAISIFDGIMVASNECGTQFQKLKFDKAVKRKTLRQQKYKKKKTKKRTWTITEVIQSMKNCVERENKKQKCGLYLKNFDYDKLTDYGDIKTMFSKYGHVSKVGIVWYRDKRYWEVGVEISCSNLSNNYIACGLIVEYQNIKGAINALTDLYNIRDKEAKSKISDEIYDIPLNPLMVRIQKKEKKPNTNSTEATAVAMAILLINQ